MIFGMGLMLVGYAAVLYGLAPRFSRATRDVAARVRGDRRRPAYCGAHQADGRPDARRRGRHAEAVHLHVHPPGRRGGVQPALCLASGAGPLARRALPVRRDRRHRPRLAPLGPARRRDRAARSLLLAATLFIGTAMCAAMPAFHWNLVACFFMGMSAGGLLPIAYSLLAETIPARRRGEAVVLVAGIGTALGFLLASWTAHWLIPTYGWRIMWFFGIPTGLALILLNRYIPESPRFLFSRGRADEAHDVLRSVRDHRLGAPGRRTELGAVEPGFASVFRGRTRAHPGPVALRPRVGARELRLPRLAAGLRREERRQRGAGDDDPRKGGAVRDPRLVRRRVALRPLEQPRDADPRGRARGGSAPRLRRRHVGRPPHDGCSRRCSSCCSCRCGRPSRRSRRTRPRSTRRRSAAPARVSSRARRSSAA